MRRRTFLAAASGAALWPGLGLAQASAPKRIGFVTMTSPASPMSSAWAEEFRRGMRDLGYVDGRDMAIETHFTDGDQERTRAVVRKLVQDKADILVVTATPTIALAKQEAGSVPIVMTSVSDPIAAGFAQSLARPGGNLTGRTILGPELAGKRIDLIREIRPGLKTIGFLGSSTDSNTIRFVRETQAEADRAGLKLVVRLAEGARAIDAALFESMRRDGVEAVIVQPIFSSSAPQIVASANEAGLPVMGDLVTSARAGAVLSLGIDQDANMRRAAYFVDRIFRGASPAELPIEQPTETKLAINLAAARRFGWTVPPALLARADEVIE
ncbi:MAG TPA: ABC transporter substrate-binding protein [Microvirga sp.]|jgi:putative ABC transport system substrate-binding protein|nr:ABC transporter substrate-binding protein [Microvirga sp.]